MEANIFGSRKILENYKNNGVAIDAIYAVGGLARKSPWIMQMCADIFHQEVIVPQIDNVPARGAAACAAVAVGKECGYPGCMDFEAVSYTHLPVNISLMNLASTAAAKSREAFGSHKTFTPYGTVMYGWSSPMILPIAATVSLFTSVR